MQGFSLLHRQKKRKKPNKSKKAFTVSCGRNSVKSTLQGQENLIANHNKVRQSARGRRPESTLRAIALWLSA